MNEIANNPLEKRNKEYYEDLKVERHGNKSFTNEKNMTTPIEKRNKEHHVNFGVCKAMNDENNGREVHASTPVETRCTRNDKDQLRQHSG